MFGSTTNKNKEKIPVTIKEQNDIKKTDEPRKKRTIYASRHSSNDANNHSSFGTTGLKESVGSFASGKVQSRTRVSNIGTIKNKPDSRKTNFGGGFNKPNSPSSAPNIGGGKPLGF